MHRLRLRISGKRRWWRTGAYVLAGILGGLLAVGAASTYASLEVLPPTGDAAVGRWSGVWSYEQPSGSREFGVVIWYPAEDDSGRESSYVDAQLLDDLARSGQVARLEALGLRYIRDAAREGAALRHGEPYPVILLSPGNATNVEFYASLAGDLASRGYVVVGLNHPGQVPATVLSEGVVLYEEPPRVREPAEHQRQTAARVQHRVDDIVAALDQLEAPPWFLDGGLDLRKVGVAGHSLGGIAAAEVCAHDARVQACVNLDGLQGGGPYSADPDTEAVSKPFMFVTKETSLSERHAALLEADGDDTYRVVIPGATHQQFADGTSFSPRWFPWQTAAQDTLSVSRGFVAAFFDRYLRGAPQATLGEVDAPRDVTLLVYPLKPRDQAP